MDFVYEDGQIETIPVLYYLRLGKWYGSLSYDNLRNLESLGLISTSELGVNISPSNIEKIKYHTQEYIVTKDISKKTISNVIFTKTGLALYRVIESEEVEGYLTEICKPNWDE